MTLTRRRLPRWFKDDSTGKRIYVTLPAQRHLGPARLIQLIGALAHFLKCWGSPRASVYLRYGQLDIVVIQRGDVHE